MDIIYTQQAESQYARLRRIKHILPTALQSHTSLTLQRHREEQLRSAETYLRSIAIRLLRVENRLGRPLDNICDHFRRIQKAYGGDEREPPSVGEFLREHCTEAGAGATPEPSEEQIKAHVLYLLNAAGMEPTDGTVYTGIEPAQLDDMTLESLKKKDLNLARDIEKLDILKRLQETYPGMDKGSLAAALIAHSTFKGADAAIQHERLVAEEEAKARLAAEAEQALAAEAKAEQWTCPACTLLNHGAACEACGADRPDPRPPVAPVAPPPPAVDAGGDPRMINFTWADNNCYVHVAMLAIRHNPALWPLIRNGPLKDLKPLLFNPSGEVKEGDESCGPGARAKAWCCTRAAGVVDSVKGRGHCGVGTYACHTLDKQVEGLYHQVVATLVEGGKIRAAGDSGNAEDALHVLLGEYYESFARVQEGRWNSDVDNVYTFPVRQGLPLLLRPSQEPSIEHVPIPDYVPYARIRLVGGEHYVVDIRDNKEWVTFDDTDCACNGELKSCPHGPAIPDAVDTQVVGDLHVAGKHIVDPSHRYEIGTWDSGERRANTNGTVTYAYRPKTDDVAGYLEKRWPFIKVGGEAYTPDGLRDRAVDYAWASFTALPGGGRPWSLPQDDDDDTFEMELKEAVRAKVRELDLFEIGPEQIDNLVIDAVQGNERLSRTFDTMLEGMIPEAEEAVEKVVCELGEAVTTPDKVSWQVGISRPTEQSFADVCNFEPVSIVDAKGSGGGLREDLVKKRDRGEEEEVRRLENFIGAADKINETFDFHGARGDMSCFYRSFLVGAFHAGVHIVGFMDIVNEQLASDEFGENALARKCGECFKKLMQGKGDVNGGAYIAKHFNTDRKLDAAAMIMLRTALGNYIYTRMENANFVPVQELKQWVIDVDSGNPGVFPEPRKLGTEERKQWVREHVFPRTTNSGLDAKKGEGAIADDTQMQKLWELFQTVVSSVVIISVEKTDTPKVTMIYGQRGEAGNVYMYGGTGHIDILTPKDEDEVTAALGKYD